MDESPIVITCDAFDKQALLKDQGLDYYYKFVYEVAEKDPFYWTNALLEDFKFRERFGLNIIASAEGEQGTAGKSLFFLWWAFKLGEIFRKPFDMDKNLYAVPEELDYNIRTSEPRTTHFLDEQRNKNVGMGSRASDLSLQDYEEQCRFTQKNILYASPEIHDHAHYFVFNSQGIERWRNEMFCANCPENIQAKCYENKFDTCCPPEFVGLRGGEKVPFYYRTGYPKYFNFLLKTKRKIDGWLVPRGIVKVPCVSPETMLAYDLIKRKNVEKFEKNKEDSFKYLVEDAELFIKEYEKSLIRMIGGMKTLIYKIKDEEGNPKLHKELFDTRKYAVVNKKTIEAYLYQFLGTTRKYTVRQIELIISMSQERLGVIVLKMNTDFFQQNMQK